MPAGSRASEREIGILDYSALFLAEDSEILHLLADKGRAGVMVRIALGDPGSRQIVEHRDEEGLGDATAATVRNALVLYRPLNEVENVEIRLHKTVLYNSIYRTDDQLLVNQRVFGILAMHASAFFLRDAGSEELAALYFDSFERVWDGAVPLE